MKTAKGKAAVGARVKYCGHDGTFIADIIRVGNVCVVRANGPISPSTIQRPAKDATHRVEDFPGPNFWRPDIGVLVVPQKQVVVL